MLSKIHAKDRLKINLFLIKLESMASLLIIIVCVGLIVGGVIGGLVYHRRPTLSDTGSMRFSSSQSSKKRNFEEVDAMYKSRLGILRNEADSEMAEINKQDERLRSLQNERDICEKLRSETRAVTTRVSKWERCVEISFKEVLRTSGSPMRIDSEEWSEHNESVEQANMRLRTISDFPLDDRRLVVSEVSSTIGDLVDFAVRSKGPHANSLSKAFEAFRRSVGKFLDCAHELNMVRHDLRLLVNKHRRELSARNLKAESCEEMLTPVLRTDEVIRFSNCVVRTILAKVLPESLEDKKDLDSMITRFEDLIEQEQTERRGAMVRANTINDRITSTLSEHYDAVKEDRDITKRLERDIVRQREMSTQMRDRIVSTIDRERADMDTHRRQGSSMRRSEDKEDGLRSATEASSSASKSDRTLRRESDDNADMLEMTNRVRSEIAPRADLKDVKKDLLDRFERNSDELTTFRNKSVKFSTPEEISDVLDNVLDKDEKGLASAIDGMKAHRSREVPIHEGTATQLLSHKESLNNLADNLQSLDRLEARMQQESSSTKESPEEISKREIKPRPKVSYDLANTAREHMPFLKELIGFVTGFFEQPEYRPESSLGFEEALAQFDSPFFVLRSHLGKRKRHPKAHLIFEMHYRIAEDMMQFSTSSIGFSSGDNVVPIASMYLLTKNLGSSVSIRNTFIEESYEDPANFEINPVTALEMLSEGYLSREIERVNNEIKERRNKSDSQKGGESAILRKLLPILTAYLQRRAIPIYAIKYIRYAHHKRNWHRRAGRFVDYCGILVFTLLLMGARMEEFALSFLTDSLMSLAVLVRTSNRRALLIPYFLLPDMLCAI